MNNNNYIWNAETNKESKSNQKPIVMKAKLIFILLTIVNGEMNDLENDSTLFFNSFEHRSS